MTVYVLLYTEYLPAENVSPQDMIVAIYEDPVLAEKIRKKWVRKNKYDHIKYTVEAWEVLKK